MVGRKKTPRWLEAARLRKGPVAPGVRADWLVRALGRAGVMPREEAERAVREGRVEVAGQVEREPFAPVHPGQEVRVDGQVRSLEAPLLVLMFHKPAGIVVAGMDPESVGTVFERLRAVLPAELQGFEWYAIGRLDRDTTRQWEAWSWTCPRARGPLAWLAGQLADALGCDSLGRE